MASMWRRAMLYLGLGPDDEYDDYDMGDRRRLRRRTRAPVPQPRSSSRQQPSRAGTRRPLRRESRARARTSARRARCAPSARSRCARRPSATAAIRRPVPAPRWSARCSRCPSAKPHVVAPTSFNHAQEVADKLKVNLPVIVNLQNVDRDLSRRIIDFASGLCYGVGGQMERVANNVFLLTPSNVEVSAEERRRLARARLRRELTDPVGLSAPSSSSTSTSSSPGSCSRGSRSRPVRALAQINARALQPHRAGARADPPGDPAGALRCDGPRPVADHRVLRRAAPAGADLLTAPPRPAAGRHRGGGYHRSHGPDLAGAARRRVPRGEAGWLQHPGRRRVPRAPRRRGRPPGGAAARGAPARRRRGAAHRRGRAAGRGGRARGGGGGPRPTRR